MSDEINLLLYIKDMLCDLVYLNGVIAGELIKITENTAAMRRGEDFLKKSKCIPEHEKLNEKIIEIIKKYKPKQEDHEDLEKHILAHED
ncbi:MAG: hypothetical protein R6U96_19040 [Promethearchaeia archaeon]